MTSPVSAASSPTSSASTISMEEFMKVLLTQLTYQDPLKPLDNQQFMAQIAQFTALEQAYQTNQSVNQLMVNQAALQSIGLIGRTVDVVTTSGPLTGSVTALSLGGSTPQLTIRTPDGATVSNVELGQVTAVR